MNFGECWVSECGIRVALFRVIVTVYVAGSEGLRLASGTCMQHAHTHTDIPATSFLHIHAQSRRKVLLEMLPRSMHRLSEYTPER